VLNRVRARSRFLRARELLGPEVWAVLRAGRPEPNARYQPGASIAELRQIVERIEKV